MLLQVTEDGIYCERGGFHIDPWGAVERAVITHAHRDHLAGSARRYLTSIGTQRLLRGRTDTVEAIEYGHSADINGVRVSLHPAGHILGSAQVRVEWRGEIWVVSGDYKLDPDPTCAAFEPVRCHTLLTEATFGLPIFRWSNPMPDIHAWWRSNQDAGKSSVLFVYPLGKAQRVLAGLDFPIGPVRAHPDVEAYNRIYRESGVPLPETPEPARGEPALILAPPHARYRAASTGYASGWMRIRGPRRRRSVDRGFVLSDHADWPQLLSAVAATGAERIGVTHGFRAPFVRWLQEQGLSATTLQTPFEDELEEA